jgi:hypothetical protein
MHRLAAQRRRGHLVAGLREQLACQEEILGGDMREMPEIQGFQRVGFGG